MDRKVAGEGDPLFAFTEYRIRRWGKRVVILVTILTLVHPVLVGLWGSFGSDAEPKEVMLDTIPDLVLRPGEVTSGWGAPKQFPKLMCEGDLDLCPVKPSEVKCWNLGLDKSYFLLKNEWKMKIKCEPTMSFLDGLKYDLATYSLNCQQCKSDEAICVVKPSCYFVYSLKNKMMFSKSAFVSGIFIGLFYWFASFLISTPQDERQRSSSKSPQPPRRWSLRAFFSRATTTAAEDPTSTNLTQLI